MLAFFRIRLGGMHRGSSLLKAASQLPSSKLFVPKLVLEVPKMVHVELPVRLATITMIMAASFSAAMDASKSMHFLDEDVDLSMFNGDESDEEAEAEEDDKNRVSESV